MATKSSDANDRQQWKAGCERIRKNIEEAKELKKKQMEVERQNMEKMMKLVQALREDNERLRKELADNDLKQSEGVETEMEMDLDSNNEALEPGEVASSHEMVESPSKGKQTDTTKLPNKGKQPFVQDESSDEEPIANRRKSSTTIQPASTLSDQMPTSKPNSKVGLTGVVSTLATPEWYTNLVVGKGGKPDRALVEQLKALPRNAKRLKRCDPIEREKIETVLRADIHKARFFKITNRAVLKEAQILDAKGIPAIASGEYVPWDIRSDATELFNLWANEEFDGDLMFGIEIGASSTLPSTVFDTKAKLSSNAYSLSKKYKGKRAWAGSGANGLQNGQWWPYQICTLRDGAHGSPQGGISGATDKGVYSIVVAANSKYKDDKDNRDEIWYSGTYKVDSDISVQSRQLMDAMNAGEPIRVIRSGTKDGGESVYSPEYGLRYDGLYKIVSSSLIDKSSNHYKFQLKRVEGQDPIRYTGAEKRPTQQEIEAFDRYLRVIRGKGFLPNK